MKDKRMCDFFTDEEWLVLVQALSSFVERYKDVDFFAEELKIAKRLMKKLYGRE